MIGAALGAAAIFLAALLNDRRTKQIHDSERSASEKAEGARLTAAQIQGKTDEVAAVLDTYKGIMDTQQREIEAHRQRQDVYEERLSKCEADKADLRVDLATLRTELAAAVKEVSDAATRQATSDP
jgi:uncharacterized coiled-coil DUF342 family protein